MASELDQGSIAAIYWESIDSFRPLFDHFKDRNYQAATLRNDIDINWKNDKVVSAISRLVLERRRWDKGIREALSLFILREDLCINAKLNRRGHTLLMITCANELTEDAVDTGPRRPSLYQRGRYGWQYGTSSQHTTRQDS
jgi:hypothetical protein